MELGLADVYDWLDEDLAALTELQRSAQALSRQLAQGRQALTEASAKDPTEALRVRLADDGRVNSVEIMTDWRRRLSPEDLGPAVVSTLQQAGQRRLEAWADAVGRPVDPAEGMDVVVVPSGDLAPAAEGLGDPSAATYARNLFYVLHDVSARWPDLEADLLQRAQEATEGHDAHRHVVVTLTGDQLTGVVVDSAWAGSATPTEVGASITAAIRSAYAAVDERAASSVKNAWPFNELDRMAGDPMQMLANLGLPVPSNQHGRS
jgi:hypothetical protein